MANEIRDIALVATGGVVGAIGVSFFWVPEKLKGFGRFAAGGVVGGIGATSAVFFTKSALSYFGADPNSLDNLMPASAAIGMVSVGVYAAVAKFFSKREDKDIAEIINDVRQNRS